MKIEQMKKTVGIAATLFGLVCLQSNAAVVALEFQTDGAQGSAFDFNQNTGSYDPGVDSVTLSFAAFMDGALGDPNDDLNATTTNFGINADGTGDDTDEIDVSVQGTEAIRITFNSPDPNVIITLDLIDINSFTGDPATFTIIGGSSTSITGNGDILIGQDVTGKTIEFLAAGTSVFGVEGIQFTTYAIPEPSSMAMMALSMVFMLQVRRVRRKVA